MDLHQAQTTSLFILRSSVMSPTPVMMSLMYVVNSLFPVLMSLLSGDVTDVCGDVHDDGTVYCGDVMGVCNDVIR